MMCTIIAVMIIGCGISVWIAEWSRMSRELAAQDRQAARDLAAYDALVQENHERFVGQEGERAIRGALFEDNTPQEICAYLRREVDELPMRVQRPIAPVKSTAVR